jgi:hypothetical protein
MVNVMANDVFANGREIACKAADGKSICAFPDVCFTPPQTQVTPPGVPIPYPNTAFASDTSEGSKNVKISGKEVMLKNQSYFKKSTGDEAGTLKGVINKKVSGKAYFNSWSMDVKIEGQNVVRHFDLTTHNHGSNANEAAPWPYINEAAFEKDSSHDCKTLADNLEKKCGEYVKKTKVGDKVKRKASIDAMCGDKECKKARECVLSSEKPNNCCDGKTPHHLIPAHCFMLPGERGKTVETTYKGCEGYQSKKAPCICVKGEGKVGQHGKFHEFFDKIEDQHMVNGGSWTYAEAREAAIKTVKKHAKKCDPDCIAAQLNAYHQKKEGGTPNISDDTPLRADSTGQHTPDGFTPSITKGK